jgi:hypothetical protein
MLIASRVLRHVAISGVEPKKRGRRERGLYRLCEGSGAGRHSDRIARILDQDPLSTVTQWIAERLRRLRETGL